MLMTLSELCSKTKIKEAAYRRRFKMRFDIPANKIMIDDTTGSFYYVDGN